MTENTELVALLYLLEDPDPEIYRRIKERIFQYGNEGIAALNEYSKESKEALVKLRIEQIMHEMHYTKVVDRFEHWLANDENNLLEGIAIVTSYKHPNLDMNNVKDGVRAIKKDIWDAFGANLSPARATGALNEVFFDRYGFEIQPDSQLEESDHFFHETLINRSGGRPAVGMLYAAIAAELNLPIYVVAVPKGNFLLAYMEQSFDSTRDFRDHPIDAHFFIDPASFGSIYPRTEAYDKYVRKAADSSFGDWLYPLSNSESIQLILDDMATYYKDNDQESHYTEIINLIRITSEHIGRKNSL